MSENRLQWVRRSVSLALFALSALGALAPLSGCPKAEVTEKKAEKSEDKEDKAEKPAKVEMTFKEGDSVDVKWKDSWWKAEVLKVKAEKYRIHYVGWSATWDEDVSPDRVRERTDGAKTGSESKPAASASAEETPAGSWKVGDKVDVNWNKAWWQGKVLSISGSDYKVHYIGWAASWDETVPASRLRAPTADAKKGTAKE